MLINKDKTSKFLLETINYKNSWYILTWHIQTVANDGAEYGMEPFIQGNQLDFSAVKDQISGKTGLNLMKSWKNYKSTTAHSGYSYLS